MSPNSCGVYYIQNTVNKKLYIGSSIHLSSRMRMHKYRLRANNHVNGHLQSAFNKYGELSFSFEVIELCNPDDVLMREQCHIDMYNFEEELYNLSPSAEGTFGHKHTDETKKKISIANTGRKHTQETKNKISLSMRGDKNHNYGKHLSDNTKKKLSEALTGRIVSDETRKKLGRSGSKHHYFGKSRSEITKNKISKTLTGKHGKQIMQIDKNNLEVISVYPSVRVASRCVNGNEKSIADCARGVNKSAAGFLWRYIT